MSVDVKLGKHAPRHDPRTLDLARYLDLATVLPKVPQKYDWAKKTSGYGILGNDTHGDCGPAGAAHQVQTWTANQGNEYVPALADVLDLYSRCTKPPFDPQTGANDNGVQVIDLLNEWRQNGIAGHKIGAFVSVPNDWRYLTAAGYLFGGVGLGFSLPAYVQGKRKWATPAGHELVGNYQPGSWGGHWVITVSKARSMPVESWGMRIPTDWGFVGAYSDERWVVVSQDWLGDHDLAPSGFNVAQLTADLALITA